MTKLAKVRNWTARVGRRGERAAASFLEDNFFEILLRNCRTEKGEIDIIARDGDRIVFVEVKTLYRRRGRLRELRPAENLKEDQKRRIYRAALKYLYRLEAPGMVYRFDLVEVILGMFGVEKIVHTRSAFG